MKVKAKHAFNHQGKNVKPGDLLDVPDHDARNLIQQGHVEQHTAEGEHEGDEPPTSGGKTSA